MRFRLKAVKMRLIITDNAIATGMMIFISLFRNAPAPSLTAFEMSIISFVPGGCFVIQNTKPPATRNDASPVMIGNIVGEKSIIYFASKILVNINQIGSADPKPFFIWHK